MDLLHRTVGCLLAGAMGDALGRPVEFVSWDGICRRYGPEGVSDPEPPVRFTDDTQMTLFTAEGLLRASVRGRTKGVCDPPSVVFHAYLRWLHTQGVPWSEAGAGFADGPEADGWLVRQPVLFRRMAPGNTCLSALASGHMGTPSQPLNASKGCGGVMRAAPVGFFRRDPATAYELGCAVAAITHGHPDGYEPAGALASMIASLLAGVDLHRATAAAAALAPKESGTRAALAGATELAAGGQPDPPTMNRVLGEGWVGEEALAIAVCCALASPTPKAAMVAAVNHSGDSDSTGSIAGNILGAAHGPGVIPSTWLQALEARQLVEQVAADCAHELLDPPPAGKESVPGEWWVRYPGW